MTRTWSRGPSGSRHARARSLSRTDVFLLFLFLGGVARVRFFFPPFLPAFPLLPLTTEVGERRVLIKARRKGKQKSDGGLPISFRFNTSSLADESMDTHTYWRENQQKGKAKLELAVLGKKSIPEVPLSSLTSQLMQKRASATRNEVTLANRQPLLRRVRAQTLCQ